MATKKVQRNNKKNVKKTKPKSLKNEVAGVLLIAAGLLLAIALYFRGGSDFFSGLRAVLTGLFGIVAYMLPLMAIAAGVLMIAARGKKCERSKVFTFVLGIVAIIVLIHLFKAEKYNPKYGFINYIIRSYEICSAFSIGSGAFGAIITYPAHLLFGKVGGIILNSAFLLISIMLICRFSLKDFGIKTAEVTKKAAIGAAEAAKKAAVAYDERRERIETKKAERQTRQENSLFVEELEQAENGTENEESVSDSWIIPKFEEAVPKRRRKKARAESDKNDTVLKLDLENRQFEYTGAAELTDDDSEFITEPSIRFDAETLELYGETAGRNEIEELQDEASQGIAEFSEADEFETDNENEDIVKFYEKEAKKEKPKEIDPDDIPTDEDDPELPFTNRGALKRYENTYTRPPLTILNESRTQDNVRMDREEMARKTGIIEQTLKSFSISAKVTNTVRGPVLTRYELQPAPGVKVRRIVDLTKDIALNLAAEDIRIEAPIPGKAAIGIEVPNDVKKMVTARELIDSDEFRRKKTPITFALGKDIVGKNVYADIARMPHLLIAGETGSGKSVCINTIIVSLIYGASPEDVQLILVDPKKVELKPYEKIPHLRIPIVTDPKKAAMALNWAVAEMMTRYKVFASKGAKDLPRYNNIMIEEGREKLPYLVIIIDELADLMMTSSKEVEDAICRIAQLGRAAGIHLIIATQTPRVTVITGNIKANVPTKIAFAVSSQMDSRVILDMSGAEKLLGRGDMLYTPPGSSKPIRVQGCYISDSEIEAITDFLTSENEQKYDDDLLSKLNNEGRKSDNEVDEDEDDEKLEEAIRIAIELGQVSSSMLQRKMKIGFNRAARIVDVMEERGYVSASEGAKPRQTLITMEQYNEIYGDKDTD